MVRWRLWNHFSDFDMVSPCLGLLGPKNKKKGHKFESFLLNEKQQNITRSNESKIVLISEWKLKILKNES